MARIETDPNYTSPTFGRATAATDPFKKEDVQLVAAALSTHDHSTGKGVAIGAASIPNGTITSAMIADGTIDTADLKDGSVTSAKILDGTIQSTDIAAAGIANDRLGPDVARDNLLTNGGFEIWQRGVGPFTANTAYTADRLLINLAGSDTLSVSKDTTNFDTAGGGATCAACIFTLSGGAGATALTQPLRPGDVGTSVAQRTISASVRVRTSTASAVRIGLHDGTAWNYGSFHTGSGTYQTLTATATVGSSGGSLGIFFAASCTAYVDNANVVVGSQPADYVPLHPADDLARCLRYYEIIGESAGEIVLSAFTSGAGNFDYTLPYKARKAVTPTVTKVGTWTVANAAQPTVIGSGVSAMALRIAASASGQMSVLNAASTYVTIEANP